MIKKIHYSSGITLAIFIGLHLINHLAILGGATTHIDLMDQLRLVYRHPIVESILLLAVLTQVFSGLKLYRKLKAANTKSWVEKYQILSGLYLAFFLLLHVSAVMGGRYIFNLDTNLYFGAAGLKEFPLYLFFIPYYFLSVAALFTHIGCIHFRKTNSKIQSQIIFTIGLITGVAIILGMTIQNFQIPTEIYKMYEF